MGKKFTDAGVRLYKAGPKRREIPDACAKGLYLIIQPSGVKSWALRYRRPNGKTAKLTLGDFDSSAGKEPDDEPKIGDPLSLVGARTLAAAQLRQLKRGIDVSAVYLGEKRRARAAVANAAANSFAAIARAFIDEHCVKFNRRWRESASLFGFDWPEDGQAEPTLRKSGLAARWKDRELRSISSDEVHDLVVEAQRFGVPGREPRHSGPSDSRGRALAAALSKFFSWSKERRHISVNPALDLFFPSPGMARSRVLNSKIDVRRADEVRWFWKATDTLSEPFGTLLKLLLLTGCRLNELAGLRTEEVSDDLGTLRIPAERVKNHKSFEVYLAEQAVKLLASVKPLDGCTHWFSTNGKTQLSGWSKIKRQLDQAMLELARAERGDDFAIPSWRIHDLRRTASTGMHSIGVPPHVVEAALNHVSGHRGGVAGVYNQEQYSIEKKAAWARWAGHVQAVVNGAQSNVVPMRA
jgi:integrase